MLFAHQTRFSKSERLPVPETLGTTLHLWKLHEFFGQPATILLLLAATSNTDRYV
jgi:hypothetical protein